MCRKRCSNFALAARSAASGSMLQMAAEIDQRDQQIAELLDHRGGCALLRCREASSSSPSSSAILARMSAEAGPVESDTRPRVSLMRVARISAGRPFGTSAQHATHAAGPERTDPEQRQQHAGRGAPDDALAVSDVAQLHLDLRRAPSRRIRARWLAGSKMCASGTSKVALHLFGIEQQLESAAHEADDRRDPKAADDDVIRQIARPRRRTAGRVRSPPAPRAARPRAHPRSVGSMRPPGKLIWPGVILQLRGALGEQHGEPVVALDERHQHGGGHGLLGKMPADTRRLCSAVRPGSSQDVIGMARRRAREAAADVRAPVLHAAASSASAAATLDAAARELGRIEQPRELGARQLRLAFGDFADRACLPRRPSWRSPRPSRSR